MQSDGTSPQRSDAQRNRERILEVALEELSQGSPVSLSVIAKRAGVGQATMYRHFPDRDVLVLAVYHREVQQLVDSAPLLLRTQSPDVAFREWLSRLAKFAVAKAGLGEAMQQASRASGGSLHPGYAPVVSALAAFVDSNRDAGTIRADITVDDVLLAIAGVWQLRGASGWEAQAARLIDLIMSGLQAGAPSRS